MSVEREIIEQAIRLWSGHRRHDGGRPTTQEIDLRMFWSGDSWYASCAKGPARTPGRFAEVSGPSSLSALTNLLGKLRREA